MQEQLTQLYGYLHGMWRYRWSALLITWIVAVAGWLLVFSLPNQYTASAVVYVDTTSIMKPLLQGIALQVDTNDELKVMSRVLLSRENLLTVIRETDMDLGVDSALEKEKLIQKLTKAIEVKGGGKRDRSNIYEISYHGDTAEGAYKVVSNLLNTMIENTLNSTRTDSVAAQKFLDEQISDYEKRLSLSEQKLAEFKKSNVGFMPDEKGSYYSRLQHAQDEVEKIRSDLKLAKQRLSELNKQLSGESAMISSDTYQAESMKKLRRYENQLEDLLQQYTDKHPDVQALRAKIEEIRSGGNTRSAGDNSDETTAEFNPVYQEIKVEVSKASVDVQILKTQLADKQAYVQKLKDSIDVIPEVEAELAKLNRDYNVTKKRYLDLVERREATQLAQDADKSTSDIKFRVIEPPIIPVKPSGPPRLLLLAAVLIVSLGAGLGWSFLKFMLEPTFFDIKQLSEKTGMPVLGTVSLYLSKQHGRKRKLQLVSFLSVTCLLVVVFSGTLVFNREGTRMVGVAMSDVKQALKEMKYEQ